MEHIYTIQEGAVAGRPGPMRIPWDLAALKAAGFTAIVSLECNGLDAEEIRAVGIEHMRICVEDFQAPTLEEIDAFNAFTDRVVAGGGRVLVHCWAGRGRTGTMLASRLIREGTSVREAVETIRAKILEAHGSLRGAIEAVQVEALHAFARRGVPWSAPTRPE